MNEQSDGDFLAYIAETLVPDLRESGRDATAEDFERLHGLVLRLVESLAAMLIRCAGRLDQNAYTVAEYKHALQLLAGIDNAADWQDVDLASLRNITLR